MRISSEIFVTWYLLPNTSRPRRVIGRIAFEDVTTPRSCNGGQQTSSDGRHCTWRTKMSGFMQTRFSNLLHWDIYIYIYIYRYKNIQIIPTGWTQKGHILRCIFYSKYVRIIAYCIRRYCNLLWNVHFNLTWDHVIYWWLNTNFVYFPWWWLRLSAETCNNLFVSPCILIYWIWYIPTNALSYTIMY